MKQQVIPALAVGLLQMALKSQENQHLLQEGDQLLTSMWHHAEAWQQLASAKEVLQSQLLLHTQLVMQLQSKEMEDRVALGRLRQWLQETQVMKLLMRGPRVGGPGCLCVFSLSILPTGRPGRLRATESAVSPAERPGTARGR